MRHIIIVGFILFLFQINMNGQTSLDSALVSIENNNPTLAARRQYWEAKKLEFQTGIGLSNPKMEFQYLFGSPAEAGDQIEFLAVQAFDFPSVYKQRRELAKVQAGQSVYNIAIDRQHILLDAKLTGIELVYRKKLQAFTTARQQALQKLVADFQKKLDEGNGNILDLNKAKLQLLQVTQLLRTVEAEAVELSSHLVQLNGGIAVEVDTAYPDLTDVLLVEQIIAEDELIDPFRQVLIQEQRIAERELALAKTWKLPKFEAGYRHQGILGQRFNGIHAGITLPLWEQKNRVAQRESEIVYKGLELRDHINTYAFTRKKQFELQASYKTLLDEYNSSFSSISSIRLLDKALALGEITIIDYFLETSFYYNAMTQFLETEKKYHEALAKLYAYKL